MKTLLLAFTFLAGISFLQAQTIPYNTVPDWQSNSNGHVATGLGLADINGDGWKDLVVANGNDIERQHLVVYYNNGDGTFPLNPDWESTDIDYHGHLACGDVDKDGDMDIAVSVYIGAEGFTSPGKVKIYYNQGNELEGTPSFQSNEFYTFSCAFGDADGDGDLDLAAAAGESYGGISDQGKIFINENGIFQPEPQWETSNSMGGMDVEFGDINMDGNMDVVFICEEFPAYIYAGLEDGQISSTPAWQSAETENYMNSVDIGYKDDQTMVVMTGNNQLGGDGKVRMYSFTGMIPASSNASWSSQPFGYGSGIILADVDLDNNLDLIYGGWWLPVKIALAAPGGFENNPSYTSQTSSVVEAIQMADLGKEGLTEKTDTLLVHPSHAGSHVILLREQLVEDIVSVTRDGTVINPADYSWVPNKRWVSFSTPMTQGETIMVTYHFSNCPDMVITNWDSNKGNYIFYNTECDVGISDHDIPDAQLPVVSLFPNPASSEIELEIRNIPDYRIVSISLINSTGEKLMFRNIKSGPNSRCSVNTDVSGLPDGIYYFIISSDDLMTTKKVIVSR